MCIVLRHEERHVQKVAFGLHAGIIELSCEELQRTVVAERSEPVGPDSALAFGERHVLVALEVY